MLSNFQLSNLKVLIGLIGVPKTKILLDHLAAVFI